MATGKDKLIRTDRVQLVTKNNNGIYQTKTNKKGKEINEYLPENCHIVTGNGTIITEGEGIEPLYHGWHEKDYIDMLKHNRSILSVEPMSAHEDKNYLTRDITASDEIAELKLDGHRATVQIGEESNRLFSRGISKITGWWGENTDQVPHIRDLLLPEYAGTILDGELDYGSTSMGVQSVTGALPETAIQYQFKNGFVNFFGFDILYYKGINVQAMPLWKRKVYLMEVLMAFHKEYGVCGMEILPMYVNPKSASAIIQKWSSYVKDEFLLAMLDRNIELVDSFKVKFREVLDAEREGLIVKNINGIYEQKRSKAFIKLKGVSTWDCVIMGITDPTKEYEGKLLTSGNLADWNYWYHPESDAYVEIPKGEKATDDILMQCDPVSKPFFMGWCGAIQFGVWKDGKLVKVGDCKGLTEKVQQDLKENWEKYVREERVFEVKANGILDEEKGSLRHPRFKKWRDDKNSEDCVWNDHIRNVWE